MLKKIRDTIHTGKIVESTLPVETVQNLLRKYIRLHVDYHAVN